jgi:hypothetical protein
MSSGEGESLIRASYSHECAKAIKLGSVATESLFAGGLQCGFVAIDKSVSRFDALQFERHSLPIVTLLLFIVPRVSSGVTGMDAPHSQRCAMSG